MPITLSDAPSRGRRLRATTLALILIAPLSAVAIEPLQPSQLEAFVAAHHAVVLDVRSAEEYAAGHVPGAINVPHGRIVAEPALLEKYRGRDLVLYCRSGRRTGLAADALEQAGFDRLYHLQGDMLGWQQQQMPLVQGPQPECRNC